MSYVNDWQESANEHVKVARRIRALATKRIEAMELMVTQLENELGRHPEILPVYFYNLSMCVDSETLDLLSRTIERSIKIERLSTSMKYHDLNAVAVMLDQQGYVVMSKQESKTLTASQSTGLSGAAIAGLRAALGIPATTGGNK